MIQYLLMLALLLVALFMILLILVQRGKGGGLAGALGGMGGQSAFGTKAGDTFTRITIAVAALWIILCIASIRLLGTSENKFDQSMGGSVPAGSRAAPTSSGKPKASSTTTPAPSGSTPAPGAKK